MRETESKRKKNKEIQARVGYVALLGRPNVGKSTLLNSMLGQKVAITSDKPQTTRTSILGIKTTEKGQIIFVDNPGIHKPLHKLNKRMMSFVYSSLESADLLCLLIDASQRFGHGDEFVIETLKKVSSPLILLLNKVDIIKKEKILLLIDHYKDLLDWKEIIPISALKGINLDVLEEKIYDFLPEAEKVYGDDDISDQSERFLLAEIIREKLLSHVEQELPFVTAVYIEKIEERQKRKEGDEEGGREEERKEVGDGKEKETKEVVLPKDGLEEKEKKEKAASPSPQRKKGVVYIRASILVERDNHRKIVIGRQGRMIKLIGTEARREIEDILEAKVFLDLSVKVREMWRDSADVLDLIEGQK